MVLESADPAAPAPRRSSRQSPPDAIADRHGVDSTTREKLLENRRWLDQAGRPTGSARAQADLASISTTGGWRLGPGRAYRWGALAAQNPVHLVERTAGRTVRDASALKMIAEQIARGGTSVGRFKPEAPAKPRDRGLDWRIESD